MGDLKPMDRRVDAAFDLVLKQRELVATGKVGSPAHRQASDVLALLEESHFILSEIRRLSMSSASSRPIPVPAQPAQSRVPSRHRRRRLSAGFVAVFAVAVLAAAVLIEIADPAPLRLQASELTVQADHP